MRSFLCFLMFVFAFRAGAQDQEERLYCGTVEAMEKFRQENPGFVPDPPAEMKSAPKGTVYIIPVVFHVVHNYGPENISDAQIEDALYILNRDFRKQNPDTSNIVSAFKAIAADAEIEFRLAQKDPQGNCTRGITRTVSTLTYSAGENVKGSTVAPAWTSPKYMNVWIVHTISSGAAGYTFMPGNINMNNDGIILRYDYTGSIGTSSPGRSRTLTHEVGHWLNLAHTWGFTNQPGLSSNCSSDDGVGDTPNTIGWTSCNLTGTSCNTLDNVQNYMDYSYCTNMFTAGQVARMRSALNSPSGQRNQLWTTANRSATGTLGSDLLCAADFTTDQQYVCTGDQVTFTDKSYHGVTSWNWSFPGGTPSSSTLQNPTVTYSSPGLYPVTLNVSNGSESESTSRSNFIRVFDSPGKPHPLYEGFEYGWIDPELWIVNNPDNGATWSLSSTGASGSYSAYIPNLNKPAERKDELISEPFDMTGHTTAVIAFKYAFARKSTADTDVLRVYVSGNCGKTWALRRALSGALLATANPTSNNFVPSSSEWKQEIVTNVPTAYLTENFMVKFEFESGGGNNIYLDDINIGQHVGMSEDDHRTSFQVFPNPAGAGTGIQLLMDEKTDAVVELADLTGKKIASLHTGLLQEGLNQLNLPSGLAPGLYFVTVRAEEKQYSARLIIK